jgi:hypothetical protein
MPVTKREERLDKKEGSILPALANRRVHCTIEARVQCCKQAERKGADIKKCKILTLSYSSQIIFVICSQRAMLPIQSGVTARCR